MLTFLAYLAAAGISTAAFMAFIWFISVTVSDNEE